MDHSTADLALLFRRAGFGARPDELRAATRRGYEATVADWLAGLPRGDAAADAIALPETVSLGQMILASGAEHYALISQALSTWPSIIQWWVARMVAASNPLTEKVPLLMHNLFPAAIAKVIGSTDMVVQNQLFRAYGWGHFDDLTLRIVHDPAMLMWLDVFQQSSPDPNQNFARELMERFAMGVGNYTQADVVAASFCFSGIHLDPHTERPLFEQDNHSPQVLLGQAGISDAPEAVRVITHSDASHRYVPSRLWSWLAWPVAPDDPVLDPLVASYGQGLDLSGLLHDIFLHPEFRSPTSTGGLVKQPVEYVAGTLRALSFSPRAIAAGDPDLYGPLAGMGQIPFDPPSVGGWGQNQDWLTSAAALARWRFAQAMVAHPTADYSAVSDAPVSGRLEAAAELLSVGSWTSSTARALGDVAGHPDELVTLALLSPEYLAN